MTEALFNDRCLSIAIYLHNRRSALSGLPFAGSRDIFVQTIQDVQIPRLAASTARLQFAEVVNQVAFGGERIVLHRHGKDVAAIVPVADLELLEQLENRMDLDEARAALKEKAPRVKWNKLKKELDLQD
jgi:prevent-host-death family protein